MPAKPPRFSDTQLIEALRVNAGCFAPAATWLEERHGLDCSASYIRHRVYDIKRSNVRDAYKEIVEDFLDIAEHALVKLILEGDGPSVRFYLKTKGGDRGYAERRFVRFKADYSEMPREVIERIAKGEDPHVALAAYDQSRKSDTVN